MKLIEFTEGEQATYQSLVLINGCFLQDWQWGEFQKSLGKKVLRFGILEREELLLVASGYLQQIGNKSYFFLPYGPILKASELFRFNDLMQFFCLELKEKYPSLIFVRFEPLQIVSETIKSAKKSIDLDPHQTLILDVQKTEEQLLSEMHPKTRYNIKVATKHGVEIQTSNELTKDTLNLLLETSKRAGIRGFDAEYYTKLVQYFREHKDITVKVYTAKHQADLLAVNVILTYKQQKLATYLFGGSADAKRNLMAPYLLHWQIIQDLKKQGFEKYDFWGVETDPKHPWYGFSKFKLGFGGEVVKYAGTWDYVLNSAWYNVYIIIRKLNRIIK